MSQELRRDCIDVHQAGGIPINTPVTNVGGFNDDVAANLALQTNAPLALTGGTTGITIQPAGVRESADSKYRSGLATCGI